MPYSLILFDADDTLFDFAESQKVSFLNTLGHFGLEAHFDPLFKTYVEISIELWDKIERNEISKEALKVQRFQRTFETHGIDINYLNISKLYLEMLASNVYLISNAVEVCKQLSQTSRLGIITNGIDLVQRQRLDNSDLKHWIEFMVVSDECGYAKPDHRIFDYTLKRAKHEDLSTVLMVGDRLETDILGANRFGAHSCWYNPHGATNTSDIQPTFEIKSLNELLEEKTFC